VALIINVDTTIVAAASLSDRLGRLVVTDWRG
jgi:hypothetical protein